MTSFLKPSDLTLQPYPVYDDQSAMRPDYTWTSLNRPAQIAPWEDGMRWPNSRMMGGDPSASLYLVGQDANSVNRYESINSLSFESGGQSTLKIRGTTQDSSGNPLGSCQVQVFRTSDDLFVSECTSDAGGYFEAPSQYPGVAHYITCYKAGSPDVTGSSINTLIPS